MSGDPWDERWKIFKENLGSGGQGKTSLVTSRADGRVAVMKRLKQQHDPERRKRMHREAEALRTLSDPGIPKLLDSNTAEFGGTIPLFIVIDHIDGPTLEQFSKEQGRLGLRNAVELTLRLLTIVERCHDGLFGHRDIKPDNVMLRGGNPSDPVLIDFGLSFNFEPASSTMITGTEQQLGNRFLALPELTTPGSTKRDARSDFTFCVGIFYYLLSRYQPMTLRDAEGKAPHERRDFITVMADLPERVRTLLTLLFARGFNYRCDDRYQDAAELRADLATLLVVPTWPEGSEGVRSAIERAQLRSKQASAEREASADHLGDQLGAFVGPIRDAVRSAAEQRAQRGIPIRELPVSHTGWRSIAHRILEGKKTHCFQFECKARGTRGFAVYLQVERSDDSESLARFTLFMHAPDHPWTGAQYLLNPGGRWLRVQHGPVTAMELVEVAISWFDDEELWAAPESQTGSAEGRTAPVLRLGDAARTEQVAPRMFELRDALMGLLVKKGGGGYNLLKLALELGAKPSEVRPLVEHLWHTGAISVFVLNDDEVVYRLKTDVPAASAGTAVLDSDESDVHEPEGQ